MLRMRVDMTATVKLSFVSTVLCASLELYIRSRPYTKVTAKKLCETLGSFPFPNICKLTWFPKKIMVSSFLILWNLPSWHSRFLWLKLDCIKLFSQNEPRSTLHVQDSRTGQISFLSSSQKLQTLKRNVAVCQLVDSSFRSNQFCTTWQFLRKLNHSFQESCE